MSADSLKERARRAFLELEGVRYTLERALCHDIDGLFTDYMDRMEEALDRYELKCGGMDFAAQCARLTPAQMRSVSRNCQRRLRAAQESPLGWSPSVTAKLTAAASGVPMSRLDLMILELDSLAMELFDEIFLAQRTAFGDLIRSSRDHTLFCIYKLYGKSPENAVARVPDADVDALIDETGESNPAGGAWAKTGRGGLADTLPRQRADLDSGIRTRARAAAARGGKGAVSEDIRKWMNRKKSHAQANARTDAVSAATKGQLLGFGEAGVEWVMIDNPLDERTTEICWAMYGTVLARDDCVPGDTAPPFHYNCRSTLVPVSDPENLGDWVEFKKGFAEWMAGQRRGND